MNGFPVVVRTTRMRRWCMEGLFAVHAGGLGPVDGFLAQSRSWEVCARASRNEGGLSGHEWN
jgi:hypothetical protein